MIPTLMSRHAGRRRRRTVEAFRRTVAVLEGSVAIGASAAGHPDDLLLALRGQRPGAVRRAWPRTPSSWPASPTAWSRRPPRYLRMDGETPADPDEPGAEPRPDRPARRRRAPAPSRASSGWSYDGTSLPVDGRRARRPPRSPPATSTGAPPRTSCSRRSPRRPTSFRKTLRGKLVEVDGAPRGGAAGRRPLPERGARRSALDGAISRVRGRSARAPPPSPVRAWPWRSRAAGRRRALRGRRRARHRAVGLRAAQPT